MHSSLSKDAWEQSSSLHLLSPHPFLLKQSNSCLHSCEVHLIFSAGLGTAPSAKAGALNSSLWLPIWDFPWDFPKGSRGGFVCMGTGERQPPLAVLQTKPNP